MVLGITGISGVGKHEAARFFEKRGWVILDADQIAHHLYRPYTYVWKAMVKRFGEEILTKEDLIDRQKLRAIVFDAKQAEVSRKALDDLSAILHPELKRHLQEKIHRHFRRKSNLVIVAALWKEMGLFELCEKVLLIEAEEDLALMRIKKRDGIDEAMYRHYTASQQIPENPDFVVENNGTLKELGKKLLNLFKFA